MNAKIPRRLRRGSFILDLDETLQTAITGRFLRALAVFDYALAAGDPSAAERAVAMLGTAAAVAGRDGHVPLWWVSTIAQHLIDDLWSHSLHVRLPTGGDGPDAARFQQLRELFIATLHQRGAAEIELWPSQLQAAARAADTTDDLVVALPTSAGKTRIAEICALTTLAEGRRIIIVTPLRALSAQTERTYRRTFGPLGFTVSSLYGAAGAPAGEADTLANRDIVISTPEKLDFALRNDPRLIDDVGLIILDEGHLIGPEEREVRYEVLVQRLLRRGDAGQRRLICLSALLPEGEDLNTFVAWLRRDEPGTPVISPWRPTRQRYGLLRWRDDHARLDLAIGQEQPFVPRFVEARQPPATPGRRQRRNPFPSNQQELVLAAAWRFVEDGQSVLIFCPQRRSVEPYARRALELVERNILPSLLTPEAEHDIAQAVRIGKEWLGQDHPAVACLRIGVAVHHGSLPKAFQREIEALLRSGALKVTIASPTLAQGLNLSAAVLLIPSLYRSEGQPIGADEFANVAGRAGRAYVDIDGIIVHVLYEPTTPRVAAWDRLIHAAHHRTIRSGLLTLVQGISQRILLPRELSKADVVEYLMNSHEAWSSIDQ